MTTSGIDKQLEQIQWCRQVDLALAALLERIESPDPTESLDACEQFTAVILCLKPEDLVDPVAGRILVEAIFAPEMN